MRSGGVRLAAAVSACALVIASCASSDDAGGSPTAVSGASEVVEETRTLIGDDGGLVEVGAASLDVPAGSLPAGVIVTAQQLDATGLPIDDLNVSDVPGPVRFLVDAEVSGPLTVRIPLADGVTSAQILSADEGSVLWSDEPTEVVDGFAVAVVEHLSLFAAVSDTVSNLSYTLFALAGARADLPDCADDPPDWVAGISSPGQEYAARGLRPNAPLLACGDRSGRDGRDGEDLLALRVTANRGYAVVVRTPGALVERRVARGGGVLDARSDLENTLLTGFADGLGAALRGAGVDAEGELHAIPALRTSDFLLSDPLNGRRGVQVLGVETVPPLDPEALAFSILVDLLSVSIAQFGPTAVEDLADCVRTALGTGGVDSATEAFDVFDDCIGVEETLSLSERFRRGLRRASVPLQIAKLTAERAVDMLVPDRIDVVVQNSSTGGDGSATPVPGGSATPASSTSMHRGDPGRSAVQPAGAPRTAPGVLWEVRTEATLGPPGIVAADGLVHVATDAGTLITLDAASGRERWRFVPPGAGELSIPAVAAGSVLVHASGGGVVHALDAQTGVERWRTSLRPSIPARDGIVIRDSLAYVTTSSTVDYSGGSFDDPQDGQVHALDVATGAVVSVIDLGSTTRHGAAVGPRTIGIGPWDMSIAAFPREGGPQLWRTDYEGPIGGYTDVAIADGVGYATDTMGGVFSFDLATGRIGRQYSAGKPYGGLAELLTTPTLVGGRLLAGGWVIDEFYEPIDGPYGIVVAFDVGTGASRWSTRLPTAAVAGPAVSGGVALVGTVAVSGGGGLHALDVATGVELWRLEFPGAVGEPVVLDRTVYVADASGTVTALR